jgi:hypothetical protein
MYCLELKVNQAELDKYQLISSFDMSVIPEEHRLAYELAIISLKSKQCNEPYELLMSKILGLHNIDAKHGWDAVDREENPQEFYEFKPSSKTNSPTGSINDDSIEKIEKYEQVIKDGKKAWIILGGINKGSYLFNCLYKFPAEIYNQARRDNLLILKKNNNNNTNQSRSIYNISITKSIRLCEKFNKNYYVWKRNTKDN